MARKSKPVVTTEQPVATFVAAPVVEHDAHVEAFKNVECEKQENLPPIPGSPAAEVAAEEAAKKAAEERAATAKQLKALGRELAQVVGTTDAKVHRMQHNTQETVARVLTDMFSLGYKAEMFKKNDPVWEEITREIQIAWGCHLSHEYAAYVANTRADGKGEPALYGSWAVDNGQAVECIPDQTLHNRRSQIRKFLTDKEKAPAEAKLDLYGNAGRTAAAKNKQVHHVTSSQDKNADGQQPASGTGQSASTPASQQQDPAPAKPVQQATVVKVNGTVPLAQFLLAWHQANKGAAALEKFVGPVETLLKLLYANGDIAKPDFMKE